MKRILNDIKQFKGNVVCVGVEDRKIKKELMKNSNIGLYELNRPETKRIIFKKKRLKTNNGKSVSIKKFRKLFKKKSIEYLIIDIDKLMDYYKYIASNSIYMCNKKIYIYGTNDTIDATDISKKFKRYKTETENIQIDNEYLTIIDWKNAKYSKIKEKVFLVIDSLHNLGDMISYFLTS